MEWTMAKTTTVQQALIATLEAEGFCVTKPAAAPQPKAAAKKTQTKTSAKPSTRKTAPKEDTVSQTELIASIVAEVVAKLHTEIQPKAATKTVAAPKAPKGRKAPQPKAGRRHIKDGRLFETPVAKLAKGDVFQLSAKGAQYTVTAKRSAKGTTVVGTDHPKVDKFTFGEGRTVLVVS